jgi:hypothetical protein
VSRWRRRFLISKLLPVCFGSRSQKRKVSLLTIIGAKTNLIEPILNHLSTGRDHRLGQNRTFIPWEKLYTDYDKM